VGLGGKGSEGRDRTDQEYGRIRLATVELIYALSNNIPYGSVKNSSGSFIKADLASVSAAAAGAAKTIPDDFRVSITDAPGKNAYPHFELHLAADSGEIFGQLQSVMRSRDL